MLQSNKLDLRIYYRLWIPNGLGTDRKYFSQKRSILWLVFSKYIIKSIFTFISCKIFEVGQHFPAWIVLASFSHCCWKHLQSYRIFLGHICSRDVFTNSVRVTYMFEDLEMRIKMKLRIILIQLFHFWTIPGYTRPGFYKAKRVENHLRFYWSWVLVLCICKW